MSGMIAAAAVTVVGGIAQASAAGRAASTQADAARQAGELQRASEVESLALQREIFNQQRADTAPFRQAGLGAQNQLLTYLGLAPQASAMAPTTQFDEAGYNRAMDSYNQGLSSGTGVPGQGTFTPGYYQDSGGEGGASTYIDPVFTPAPAAAAGAGMAMPTREQFTTTMPVDQLNVNTASPDFGRYAQDFRASAEAALPPSFRASAETALPAAFTGQVDLQADPGYQFRLSEGMKALNQQAAARGGLISGAALKGAQRFGQDLGSQEYGAAYGRALTEYGAGVDRSNTVFGRDLTQYGADVDRSNTLFGREYDVFQSNYANAINPLLALTGSGQIATNQLGNYGSRFATNAAGTMSSSAANQANALGAAGQARASGYMGQANALNATLGNLANIGGQYRAGQTPNNLTNISSMGTRVPSTYGPVNSPFGFSGGLYN